MLWLIEFRKHLPFFSVAIGPAALTGVAAALVPDQPVLEVIRTLSGMLVWCGSVVYVAADLARFLTLGNDVLLHIGAPGQLKTAGIKAASLGAFLLALHAATLIGGAATITETVETDAPAVFAYFVVAKAVSIVTYLVTVVFAASAAKVFRARGSATTAFIVVLVGIVVGQTLTLWRLGAPDTDFFFIGVGGDFLSVNLYANILPIILTPPSAGFLPPIAGLSVLLNSVLSFVAGAITLLLMRFRRFDFITL